MKSDIVSFRIIYNIFRNEALDHCGNEGVMFVIGLQLPFPDLRENDLLSVLGNP